MGSEHHWGDDFDFASIGHAADEIGAYCVKWGRIPVTQTKEKYGTVRVYNSWGIENLYWLIRPNYHYYKLPIWVRKLDDRTFGKLFRFALPLIFKYQTYIYNKAYQKAVKKYPHLREEILVNADWPEFIDNNEDIMKKNWSRFDENGNEVAWTKPKSR